MTHDQLILAAAAALFVAFLIGWLAAWLVLRSAGTPVVQVVQAPPRPADDARLSAAEADASAAKEALDEARIEIEELRD